MRTGIVLFLALLGNPAFAATLNSVAGTTTELTQIRVDHCSFKGGVSTVEWFNWAYGVVDQRWRARNIPTGW
jgi:hypothetical protein